jgi:hypothetical protein
MQSRPRPPWGEWWCRTMHDEISWPRKGKYHCLQCRRVYLVPWSTDPLKVAPQTDAVDELRALLSFLVPSRPLEAKNAGNR